MYIARWKMTVKSGQRSAVVDLLRKWEMDVGQRIGWRAASIRVLSGLIGVSESEIEFEVRVDTLSDLEGAWSDMRKNPHHAQYLKEIDPHIVSGSNVWHVLEVIELTNAS